MQHPVCNLPYLYSNSCHFWHYVMIFLVVGFCLRVAFVFVMHLISCHHVHRICIRVRLMHPSIFPRCPFCIPAPLCPPTSPFASFRVRVLNVFGLDQDLPSGLGILPVDRLPSFVPFGLHLILQRLTEERKGLVCVAAQHPSKVAQNPPKPPPSSRPFDHDRVAANRTLFGLSWLPLPINMCSPPEIRG